MLHFIFYLSFHLQICFLWPRRKVFQRILKIYFAILNMPKLHIVTENKSIYDRAYEIRKSIKGLGFAMK